MTDATLFRLFPIALPILFVAMWLAVTTLLGTLSGWFALQRHYPATDEPALLTLRMRSGGMGAGVHINGCLTLAACRSGLRIRIWRIFGPFQRPLLVPWNEISVTSETFFFMPMIRLGFGSPELGRFTIDARTWDKLRSPSSLGGDYLRSSVPGSRPGIHTAYLWQWLAITAIAGSFFFVASRLATGNANGLPVAECFGFPALLFGGATLMRWLVED